LKPLTQKNLSCKSLWDLASDKIIENLPLRITKSHTHPILKQTESLLQNLSEEQKQVLSHKISFATIPKISGSNFKVVSLLTPLATAGIEVGTHGVIVGWEARRYCTAGDDAPFKVLDNVTVVFFLPNAPYQHREVVVRLGDLPSLQGHPECDEEHKKLFREYKGAIGTGVLEGGPSLMGIYTSDTETRLFNEPGMTALGKHVRQLDPNFDLAAFQVHEKLRADERHRRHAAPADQGLVAM